MNTPWRASAGCSHNAIRSGIARPTPRLARSSASGRSPKARLLRWGREALSLARRRTRDSSGSEPALGLRRARMPQGPRLPRDAFSAEHGRDVRVLERLVDRAGLAVHHDRAADETEAVAVVHVSGAVDRAQRLDGILGPAMPSVDRHAVGKLT